MIFLYCIAYIKHISSNYGINIINIDINFEHEIQNGLKAFNLYNTVYTRVHIIMIISFTSLFNNENVLHNLKCNIFFFKYLKLITIQ